jgi:hypothetical protein
MSRYPLFTLAAPALLATLLSGCATQGIAGHHPETAGGQMGMQMSMQDMKAMCEMHRSMMQGKAPAERQALMAEHMKHMSPEMQPQMQAMQQHCK